MGTEKYYFLIFVLFPILISFTLEDVFADTFVSLPEGSAVPGCEETAQCFIPDTVLIIKGETVTWINDDTAAHTVTSGAGVPDGYFDSSLFMAGSTYSVTFSEGGAFDYFCMVHPWMTGIVIVADIDEPQPTPYVPPITVTTDRSSYKDGDTIRIFGEIGELLSGFPVTLQIIASNGNLAAVIQTDVRSDFTYETYVTAGGGEAWRSSGTYTVKVIYGTEARTAETSFYFSGSTVTVTPSPTGSSINVQGFSVSYQIVGGSVFSITPDVDANSLIIEIFSSSNGQLTITLPRALIDAVRANGDDDNFFVLVDGGEAGYDETKTSIDRTLTIKFNDGAEEIEIIGTGVFGNLPSPIPTPAPTPPPPRINAPSPISTSQVKVMAGSSVPGCEEAYRCYSPFSISVSTGTTVTWTNADSAAHTVTSGNAADGPNGFFDSSLFMAGQTFSHRFNSPGTFEYFCMLHPWKVGEVIVRGTSVSTPTAPHDPSIIHTISVSGTSGSIEYRSSAGKVLNAIGDWDARSIILMFDTNRQGQITVTIPRSVLDAKLGRADDDFFILVNREEMDYDETKNMFERTLTIWFTKNTNEIEIIGTVLGGTTPTTITPTIPSFADVIMPAGTAVPGCEDTDKCFIPSIIRVDRGDTVTWYNGDTAAHTVTSGNAGDGPDGTFDSSLFMAGSTYSVTFSEGGAFDYFCMVHPWMAGTVIVGTGTSPPPPTPGISLRVFVNQAVYDPGDIVNVEVEFSGAGSGKNVAVGVTDPSGLNIISRTITTDSRGNGEIQFKLSENSRGGMYQVDVTASLSGVSFSDTTFFSVHTDEPSVSIVTLQATDQQGNLVSSFERGKMGFVKVILNVASSESVLVTVNLFDSELTSLGIGSFKTTLSPGDSEILLSFFIPSDASSGTGNIYANVFSDWPSQGGTPLTGESSTTVNLR